MKKILIIFLAITSVLCLTGCSKKSENQEEKVTNKFENAKVEGENVIINTNSITKTATFVNYKVDDITIQFIVVKRSDGTIGIAFNTCQACNPSPNAYFIQKGKYFECQNCGNRFYIDDIGREAGGCNPAPVLKYTEEENIITIDKEYADSYKEKFANWNGVLSSN